MQIKKTKTRFAAGFTLLELLVAMALMDVIAVALYSSMHIAFRTKQNTLASLEPYRWVMPIFEFIRRDLTSAMNPNGILAGVFVGENVPFINLQDADTLSFYSAAYQPKENEIASNVIHVQYGLETDTERDQIVLKRFTTKNILTPTAIEPEQEVIARNMAGLDIQYYDGTAWLDTWDSSEQDSTLPWAVRVTISILDENRGRFSLNDDPYRHFTRIFMLPFANQVTPTDDGTQSASGGAG
jgi:general secretion pathway protein J